MRFASEHLLLGGEQLDLADRAQVEAQRVEARLDREVDLGPLRPARPSVSAVSTALTLRRQPLDAGLDVARDHVDADLGQVAVQVPQLVVGEVDLLEACGDLVVGQVATLLTFRDQFAKLLAFQCCVGEKRFLSCCQLSASLSLRTRALSPDRASARILHFALPSRDVRRDRPCLLSTTTAVRSSAAGV